MRIVVCLWDFFGGGAERVAVLLANALAAEGAEVKIYTALVEGPNRALVDPGIEVIPAPGKGARSFLAGLRGLVRDWRPDVIQAHQTTRNVLAILAHLTTGGHRRRLVVGVEHGEMDHTIRHQPSTVQKHFFRLAKPLYGRADLIVSVSENVRAAAERYIRPFRARHRVMENPVVFPGLEARSHEPSGHAWLADRTAPVAISLGRLNWQKNVPLLIDAWALLGDLPARLVIFGEGDLRPELEAQVARLGLGDRVALPGYTTNPFAELRAADLFVLASHWEGLPTVAIEALACGTPVVSTDNSTGIHDILRTPEAGTIVPRDDAAALAAAIRKRLGSKAPGLEEQAARFRADAVARMHLDLYRQMLAGKDRRRRQGA